MPWLEVQLDGERAEAVELGEGGNVIGRHPECEVVLAGATISRRHARLFESSGDYYIEDLGSRHGTEVNGTRLEAMQCLEDADRIRIREALLVFHLHGSPPAPPEIVSAVDGGAAPPLGDTVDVVVADPTGAQLQGLLALTRCLGSSLDLDEILPAVIESALRFHPQAQRGTIWLLDGAGGLVPRAARDRSGPCAAPPLSQTVAHRVIEKRQAVISEDASHDQRFDASRSIVLAGSRSLVCAPLLGSDGRILGLLQVDSQAAGHPLGPQDLAIATNLANLAGRAVEHLRLHEAAKRRGDR